MFHLDKYSVAILLCMIAAVFPRVSASQDTMFRDVATEAGIQGITNDLQFGIAWGDYDNDGDDDLFVANDPNNQLFRNNGDGTFTNVAAIAGVEDVELVASGGAWGDYDGDGDLDLFVVNAAAEEEGTEIENRLFRNNGDGTFTNVADETGVSGHEDHDHGHEEPSGKINASPSQDDEHDHEGEETVGFTGAAWADYDNDGDLDLIVCGRGVGVILYSNHDGDHFHVETEDAGLILEAHHHDEDGHDHGEEESFVRVLISDWENGQTKMLDPNHGEIIANFETETSSGFYVYSSSDNRYGYVIQTSAGKVTVIDSGIWEEDHGDHLHPFAVEPSLLPFGLEGNTPIHFVSDHGHTAIFFDGTGTATLFDEHEFPDPGIQEYMSPKPHHGVAVPFEDRLLVSTLGETDTSPQGVDVFGLDGTLLQSFPTNAPGLHGEAVLGNKIAFGSSNGVFVLEWTGNEFLSSFIPNPADGPVGRVGTIVSHPSLPHVIGNFNRDYVVLINLDKLSMNMVKLPSPFASFTVDAEGKHIVTISADGKAHVFEASDGTYKGAITVMDEFSVDVARGTPLPSIIAGWHNTLLVSDPYSGHVFSINVESMSVVREYHVEGAPTNMTVLGLTKYQEEHEEEGHEETVGVEHASFADYDNDGDLDLYLSVAVVEEHEHEHEESEAPTPAQAEDPDHDEEHNETENRFFINNGDGTFTEATDELELGDPNLSVTHSSVWGDYNNDGWFDLLVLNLGSFNEETAEPSRLFHNNGDGSFSDVADAAGLVDLIYPLNATWTDLNNDGWLDIVMINHPSHDDFQAGEFYNRPHPIFINNGDGTFTNINKEAVDALLDTGVTDINHVIGLGTSDYDNDGDMDFAITENHGDGPFLLYANQTAVTGNKWLQIGLQQEGFNTQAIGARVEVTTGILKQYRIAGSGSTGFASQSSQTLHFGIADADSAEAKVIWSDGTAELYAGLAVNQKHILVKGQGSLTAIDEWMTY